MAVLLDDNALSLPQGALIRTPRQGGIYYHYGVHLGFGDVFEMAGDQAKDIATARTRIVPIATFRGGQRVEVVSLNEPTYSPEVLVMRAIAMRGRGGYSLLNNNCEHVARELVTGRSISNQIERLALVVAVLTLIVLARA